MSEKIRVYISYLQESEELRQKVLILADELNTNGIDCAVDQYEMAPINGWPQWRINRIHEADYILLICTSSYFQVFSDIGTEMVDGDKNAYWEKGLIIGQLYENPGTQKIIPVYFGIQNKAFIPLILRHTTTYQIDDRNDFDELYRYLTNQPTVIKPISHQKIHKVNLPVNLDTRNELLSELERMSKARNVTRWMALGLTREIARALAEDPDINNSRFNWEQDEKPICMLVGDYGAGKSLQAEHIYQKAINNYIADEKARIPIFLKAKDAVGNLKNIIEDETNRLFGNLNSNGAIIIIDGADEVGINAGINLLEEARFLTEVWPKSSFLITSRPIPVYTQNNETVYLPNLSETDSLKLIKTISGMDIHIGISHQWPKSIKDAMKRPLFAILIGMHLKDRDMYVPTSAGELLAHLIEKLLPNIGDETSKNYALLQRLAIFTTDRGGKAVPKSEIGFGNEISHLLESRLVIQDKEGLSFSLPLFTQWFASQALINGLKDVKELISSQEMLDNWHYAIVILLSTYDHDRVFDIFSMVVENNPGYASRVVAEGLAKWGLSEEIVPPPALECGKRVRSTMESWANGIGPLAELIAPVQDGRVRSLGVSTIGSGLITSWYRGKGSIEDIVLLSKPEVEVPNIDWPSTFFARPGKQSAWAWKWTLNELQRKLEKLLKSRSLPIFNGPILEEKMWNIALVMMNKGSLYDKPIPLEAILGRIDQFNHDIEFVKISREEFNIKEVRAYIKKLIKNDVKELNPPWPCADLEKHGGWVWEPYSDERILERTQFIYLNALEAYNQLIDMWFPSFKERLITSVLQPTRLVGELIIRKRSGYEGSPSLHWFFEPLNAGESNLLDIKIVSENNNGKSKSEWESNFEKFQARRPQAAGWITSIFHQEHLEVFHSYPITNIVYDWLWSDLKHLSLVDGHIGYRY
ncbi:MAG TPA: SEFIR domain-containing protein [Bacillus sp. (in: firmicutes)]|nr:SEFIR domain-containing protein [Bacillus sp. (in: firmicutes)]